MKFQPATADEVATSGLMEAGEYNGTVVEATEKVSGSGNEMIEIRIDLDTPSGGTYSVYDWLLGMDSMAWKLRHFAESANLVAKYDAGELGAEDVQGSLIRCRIIVEKGDDEYGPRNRIKDYVERTSTAPAVAASASTDDVPF